MHAVGAVLEWQQNIVLMGTDPFAIEPIMGCCDRLPERADGSVRIGDVPLSALKGVHRQSLRRLLQDHLPMRASIVNCIADAVNDSKPAILDLLLPSRDSRFRRLATSVASRRVLVSLYRIHIPSDFDWSYVNATIVESVTRMSLESHLCVPLSSSSGVTGAWISALDGRGAPLVSPTAELAPATCPITMPAPSAGAVGRLCIITLEQLEAFSHEDKNSRNIREGIERLMHNRVPSLDAAFVFCSKGELQEYLDDGQKNLTMREADRLRHPELTTALEKASLFSRKEWLHDALSSSNYHLNFAAYQICFQQPSTGGLPCFAPVCELFVNAAIFEAICKGDKTVESRLITSAYALVQVGWWLCIRLNATSLCVWRRVDACYRYPSFPMAVRKHGNSLLPLSYAQSFVPLLTDSRLLKAYQVEYIFYCINAGVKGLSVSTWKSRLRRPYPIICWEMSPPEAGTSPPLLSNRVLRCQRPPSSAIRTFSCEGRWYHLYSELLQRDRHRASSLARKRLRVVRLTLTYDLPGKWAYFSDHLSHRVNVRATRERRRASTIDTLALHWRGLVCKGRSFFLRLYHKLQLRLLSDRYAAEHNDTSNFPISFMECMHGATPIVPKPSERGMPNHPLCTRPACIRSAQRFRRRHLKATTVDCALVGCTLVADTATLEDGSTAYLFREYSPAVLSRWERLVRSSLSPPPVPPPPPRVRLQLSVTAAGVTADTSVRGRLGILSRSAGATDGSILKRTDVFVCSIDCTSQVATPHYQEVLRALPHSNVFDVSPRTRNKPAGVTLASTELEGRSLQVATLFAQWHCGPPTRSANCPPKDDGLAVTSDSRHRRIRWFARALNRLGKRLPEEDGTVVTFPEHVGCHCDRTEWPAYLCEIRAFARRFPHLRTVMVRTSASTIQSLRNTLEHDLHRQSQRARAFIGREFKDPLQRQNAIAFVADLEERLRASFDSDDSRDSVIPASAPKSVRPLNFGAALSSAVESLASDSSAQVANALHQQRVENDALDNDAREKLLKKLERRELSMDQLREISASLPHASMHSAVVESAATWEGRHVVVNGLRERPELNGMCGTVVGLTESGRVRIELEGEGSNAVNVNPSRTSPSPSTGDALASPPSADASLV